MKLLRMASYPDKAIDYYVRKVNVGVIEGVDATDAFTGLCGDSMRMYLQVKDGVSTDATFQAIGCAGAFASASTLTELVKGKTLQDARELTDQHILRELGESPGPKLHCAGLAIGALRVAIEPYVAYQSLCVDTGMAPR